MFERRHIEQLLKINGVPVSAPEEEIKSVLLSAKWGKKEVDTALLILRENTVSHESHVDTFHKIFQSDARIKPETLSALLGVEINIKSFATATDYKRPHRTVSTAQIVQISVLSLFLSILFILASMWFFEMGLFHITMR